MKFAREKSLANLCYKGRKMKNKINSVQFKMFAIMSISTIVVIISIIILNNITSESLLKYYKMDTAVKIRNKVNNYYKENYKYDIKDELRQIEIKNNMDIYVEDTEKKPIYFFDKEIVVNIDGFKKNPNVKTVFRKDNFELKEFEFSGFNKNLIMVSVLDNGYTLYIRIPVIPIQESVKISSKTLMLTGIIIILISSLAYLIISRDFTKPIVKLNKIAEKITKLDFSEKIDVKESDDEISTLGKNVNIMSDKLERIIEQLRNNNDELEKDIEEKAKIDEMRKQFISDVSHELKTPIGLIQGYAEGLIENVNDDPESRKFYAEVIKDEANKMDILVKQLLELMKLEYQERSFNDREFELYELIKEEVRRQTLHLQEKNIKLKYEENKKVIVNADQIYIEQVLNNYITNAIKNCEEINGEKIIEIRTEETKENKIRLTVFNTGKNISKENINKIWGRFYKVDSARRRENGGTGIGLALVKAIMNNYNNKYGITNLKNGVEFYCDINK